MSKKKSKPGSVLNDASEASKSKIDHATKLIRDILETELGEGADFEEYEEAAVEIVNEIARRELERKLKTMADSYAPHLRIDHNNDWHGIREGTAFNYRQHQPGTVTYHSLVGGLRVLRHTYREGRNGGTYVPLELDAGLMERMTPGLARCVALGYAEMPMRNFERLLRAAGCRPPSRSTLERCAADLGSYAMSANKVLEPEIRAQESVPPTATRIALGLDRAAVPMRPSEIDRGIEFTNRNGRRSRPHPSSDSGKGRVQWRMDYVGTVTWVDSSGERLSSRQYRSPSDAGPEHVTTRMMADVRHSLAQQAHLEIAVIQDGAPELWRTMRTALENEPAVKKWDEVLDWFHLNEHLSKCLDLMTAWGPDRRRTRERWEHALLEQADGCEKVINSLKRQLRRVDGRVNRREFKGHISYLERYKEQARYARYRRRGVPIGSGPTEGACKSLIAMRAKRSGQRWSQRGLTAALHLRSIQQSDRFDAFWPLFASRYRATSIAEI